MTTVADQLELADTMQRHARAMQYVRRGVCLLNAGAFEEAAHEFQMAERLGCTNTPLPSFLAACYAARERYGDAAAQLKKTGRDHPAQVAVQIRLAHVLHEDGRCDEAISTLRDCIASHPESTELHYQLGTLLTEQNDYEEAELRFTQVLNLDRQHTEAYVSLGLCCGVRQAPDEALRHLRQAQSRRPRDARIGKLVALAAKAAGDAGYKVGICATMPDDEIAGDPRGVEELAGVIENDPEFIDAILSLPVDRVHEQLFAVVLKTIQVALERQPEHAELHYHCGRVLARLGRRDDAIDANEKAVAIDPKCAKALVELGRLYQETDRHANAAERLEQAIDAGAAYADVYFMLGNLYRDRGDRERARAAYVGALQINKRYGDAQEALDALSG